MDSNLIIFFGILIISVVLHELGHGYVARWLGDETAFRMGRLTLNPIAHIDLFYTIILPIVLYVTVGLPFGGAKPVPVQPASFINVSPRKGMMLVAIAGPMVNFCLAALAVGLMYLMIFLDLREPYAQSGLIIMLIMNLLLGIFNLVPMPPLDGSRVLAGLLPRETAMRYMRLERFGIFILIGLLLFNGLEWVFALGLGLAQLISPFPFR